MYVTKLIGFIMLSKYTDQLFPICALNVSKEDDNSFGCAGISTVVSNLFIPDVNA